MNDKDLLTSVQAAIARLHAAMASVANGDVSAIKALYSHTVDATSFYGWGGYEKGWDAVSKRWDWAGTQFKGGSRQSAAENKPKDLAKGTGVIRRTTMKRRTLLAGLGATAAGVLGMPSILKAQQPVTLNGAVQFNDDHAFNRALIRFEEL